MTFTPPLGDIIFNIENISCIDEIVRLSQVENVSIDVAKAVLEECGRFCREVVAPLNAPGDRAPTTFEDGKVCLPKGFREAYTIFAESGWQGVQHPVKYGGQGLPRIIGSACNEIINAANMSFALCPLLTDGAIDALLTAASDALKSTYLEKLVSGAWTGTMNLTEPQAGSDLSLLRTRAERRDDGSYRIFGTKIFITYGEHDQAENIIHLVLARLPDAPEGVKGISLFLVPKFMVGTDGSLGARNDVNCIGIEHKLGIRASPTAALQFGEKDGAIGYLVGDEHCGLKYMFVMMNSARYAVGVQGLAIAERAYQQAVSYAYQRIQGRPVDGSAARSVAIVNHPDVRRLLMRMRALTEGCRSLATLAAGYHDLAHRCEDPALRTRYAALYEFLVPLVKGYCTETSLTVTSDSVQIHGGMGFIEETGVAQYYRDARILTIYEGTTAIQASDLVGRKTLRDNGAAAMLLACEIAATETHLRENGSPSAGLVAEQLQQAREAFLAVVDYVLAMAESEPNEVYAGSVSYLMLAGNLMAGWQMARSLLAAESQLALGREPEFMSAKIVTARFYAEHILPETVMLRDRITRGGKSAVMLPELAFGTR